MARARRTAKTEEETFYAWSDLYRGGESKETRLGRRIIHSRNIIPVGSEVTQDSVDADDEEWGRLLSSGVVRNYPLPAGYIESESSEGQSPVTFVQEALKAQIEGIEEGSAAMTAEDLLVRSAVVGTQIFGPSPEQVLAEAVLPEGVEEVDAEATEPEE